MCTCEMIDYLIINSHEADISTSETDFYYIVNGLNTDFERCSFELINFIVKDGTSPSNQLIGSIFIHANVSPININSRKSDIVGVVERYPDTTLITKPPSEIKSYIKTPHGQIHIQIKDINGSVFNDSNIDYFTLIFKVTYHQKTQKLL